MIEITTTSAAETDCADALTAINHGYELHEIAEEKLDMNLIRTQAALASKGDIAHEDVVL